MKRIHHVKTRLPVLCALLPLMLLAFVPGSRAADEDGRPEARELMAMVRANQAAQEQAFTGRLRTSGSRERIVVPFQLTMAGGTITYQFSDPAQTIRVRLGENDSRIETSGADSGKTALDTPVRGTDVTFEDIALKFLYWTNARTLGEELVGSRNCWVVQAAPPRGGSQYDLVRLWIEKSGALLKADCYREGKRVRRFEVRGVQRSPSGSGYILKSMRIQRAGEDGRELAPTYLEITPIP